VWGARRKSECDGLDRNGALRDLYHMNTPENPPPTKPKMTPRAEREAAALRENLRRRREQARTRSEKAEPDATRTETVPHPREI